MKLKCDNPTISAYLKIIIALNHFLYYLFVLKLIVIRPYTTELHLDYNSRFNTSKMLCLEYTRGPRPV